MNIAVLTLTRDRLDYTKHCFAALEENAGTEYEHWVLDQGSSDGSAAWLHEWSTGNRRVLFGLENVGISRGTNHLLDALGSHDFDVIIKADNDCELTTPDTLADIAYLVHTYGLLLSPVIRGLRQPPATLGKPLSLGGQLVDEKAQIGGIFLAAPASLYDDFRYSESNPAWGNDDVEVCAYWRAQGGKCGYVQGYEANHFLGTEGQWADQPAYFARTLVEGKAVL